MATPKEIKLTAENKKLRAALKNASEEISRTGCSDDEWLGKLLNKINKALKK